MGLFSSNRYWGGLSSKDLRRLKQPKSKLWRTIEMLIIFGAVLAVTLGILVFVLEDLRQGWLIKSIFVVFALCLGGGISLPWISFFERMKKFKTDGEEVKKWNFILCYVFFSVIIVCTILWIINVFILSDTVFSQIFEEGKEISEGEWKFLEIVIIFTIQLLYLTAVLTSTLRMKKEYLLVRSILYIASLYLDIYVSWAIHLIFTGGLSDPAFNSTLTYVLAIVSFVSVITATCILFAIIRRKQIQMLLSGDTEALLNSDEDTITYKGVKDKAEPAKEEGNGVQERLAELKSLLDNGIITQDEYAEKRKDIIDKL